MIEPTSLYHKWWYYLIWIMGCRIKSILLLTAPSKCSHACKPQLLMVFVVWICKEGIIRQVANRHTCSCTCVDQIYLGYIISNLITFQDWVKARKGQKIKIHLILSEEIYFNIHEIYMYVHIYLWFLPLLQDNTQAFRKGTWQQWYWYFML